MTCWSSGPSDGIQFCVDHVVMMVRSTPVLRDMSIMFPCDESLHARGSRLDLCRLARAQMGNSIHAGDYRSAPTQLLERCHQAPALLVCHRRSLSFARSNHGESAKEGNVRAVGWVKVVPVRPIHRALGMAHASLCML